MADRSDLGGDWDYGDERSEGGGLPPFITDPLGVLRRRWVWMLAAAVLGVVATGVAVVYAKPTYSAEATVLISRQQIPEDFVRSTVREDSIANINAMISRVLSQENLERLIEQQGLFSQQRSDAARLALVAKLRGNIDVGPKQGFRRSRGDSSLIYGVEYSSTNPVEAAEVSNALASLFMEASIERRSTQARRTTEFLQRQLERDEAELREESRQVADFRREHRGELPGELDTALRRLELLAERRQSLVDQIAAKENGLLTLAATPRQVEKTANEVLLDELRRSLARESAVHTDEHPNVVALSSRVRRLESIVAKERETGGASYLMAAERRGLELLQQQLIDTDEAIQELNLRIDETPKIGEQLAVLEQKERVLRDRYLDSLRKVEEAELAESLESAQQGAQVSVIDPAQIPREPKRPRWMLVVGGLVGSIALAFVVAVLLELVDPVIVSTAQLEQLADPRCLGTLPNSA